MCEGCSRARRAFFKPLRRGQKERGELGRCLEALPQAPEALRAPPVAPRPPPALTRPPAARSSAASSTQRGSIAAHGEGWAEMRLCDRARSRSAAGGAEPRSCPPTRDRGVGADGGMLKAAWLPRCSEELQWSCWRRDGTLQTQEVRL